MNITELGNAFRQGLQVIFFLMEARGISTHAQDQAMLADASVIWPAAAQLLTVAWSIYAHWNMKKVPENSVAIHNSDVKNPPIVGTTVALNTTGKVVGALLLCLMFSNHASAQTKVDPAIALAVKLQLLTPEKLQAALDDAIANGDPYSPACFKALIPLAAAAQASSAAAAKPKGTPGGANINLVLVYQKLRDFRRAAQTIQNALNGGASNTDIVMACAPMALDSATVINMVIGQIGGAAALIPK